MAARGVSMLLMVERAGGLTYAFCLRGLSCVVPVAVGLRLITARRFSAGSKGRINHSIRGGTAERWQRRFSFVPGGTLGFAARRPSPEGLGYSQRRAQFPKVDSPIIAITFRVAAVSKSMGTMPNSGQIKKNGDATFLLRPGSGPWMGGIGNGGAIPGGRWHGGSSGSFPLRPARRRSGDILWG